MAGKAGSSFGLGILLKNRLFLLKMEKVLSVVT